MSSERLYLAAYDIADEKRLRSIASVMEGFGYRIQFSVFLCRLTPSDLERLKLELSSVVDCSKDQCLIIDMGSDVNIKDKTVCIGRRMKTIPHLTII